MMALSDSLIDRLLQSHLPSPLCPTVPNGEDTSQSNQTSAAGSVKKDPSVEPEQSMSLSLMNTFCLL